MASRLQKSLIAGFAAVVVVLVAILGGFQILNSHDEPLVVDNPDLVVGRLVEKGEEPPEPEEGSNATESKAWKIHESNKFLRLHIRVTNGGKTRERILDLRKVQEVRFELSHADGSGSETMSIQRKGFLKHHAHLQLPTTPFTLSWESAGENTLYRFKPTNTELHVKHVYVGDKPYCVRGPNAPTDALCMSTSLAERVQIVLCVDPDPKDPQKQCPAQQESTGPSASRAMKISDCCSTTPARPADTQPATA